jgi:hypothetical protein
MPFGNSTFTAAGTAVSDIFAAQGDLLKAQGSEFEKEASTSIAVMVSTTPLEAIGRGITTDPHCEVRVRSTTPMPVTAIAPPNDRQPIPRRMGIDGYK